MLDGPAAAAAADELTGVYRAAFTAPGYDETEEQVQRFRDEQLPAHVERDGFRCATLRVADDWPGSPTATPASAASGPRVAVLEGVADPATQLGLRSSCAARRAPLLLHEAHPPRLCP